MAYSVLSLAQDRQGRIWAGTNNGLFQVKMNGGLEFDEVAVENWKDQGLAYTEMLPDADGFFTSETSLQFEDSRGDIWVTQGENLIRRERQTGRLIPYTHGDGLPLGNGAISYAEDSHGNVWLGFYFGGLARYRDGKFRLFTEADGLPASQVSDLLTDSQGRLWAATSGHGLFRLDDTETDQPAFNNYSTANGLSSNHLMQRISQLGETETRPLELESSQRQIQVDFFALTFGAGENIHYQYRLDGQDWSTPVKQQTLNLDLASGRHTLMVRAIRNDNVASQHPAVIRKRARACSRPAYQGLNPCLSGIIKDLGLTLMPSLRKRQRPHQLAATRLARTGSCPLNQTERIRII